MLWKMQNESTYLDSWYHSHKKQKNSLETGDTVDIFAWTWNIWSGREYTNTAKNGSFCEELLSENGF